MRCHTRALKNAQHIHKVAVRTLPSASSTGFGTGIPMQVLGRLHELPEDHPDIREHSHVVGALADRKLPKPDKHTHGPLFHGVIHFVQIRFLTPLGVFRVPTRDMITIVEYAHRAVVPISGYAAQYGPNKLAVSPKIIRATVTLRHNRFGEVQVRKWVDGIATRHGLSLNSALAIISPKGVSAADVSDNCGYHGCAVVPYTVIGVHDKGLTLHDPTDSFAMAVSHELAELTVDPIADDRNPEVCDPCDLNCGRAHRNYFDATGRYIGSTDALPPPFAYDFYVCAVVKPGAAGRCPASSANCDYGP